MARQPARPRTAKTRRFSVLRVVVAGFGMYFLLYANLLFFLTLKEVVRRGIENNGGEILAAMTEAAADLEAALLLPGDQAPATRQRLAPGGGVQLAGKHRYR